MSTKKLALIAAFAVLSGAPLAVSAEIIHPADTEMGYTLTPIMPSQGSPAQRFGQSWKPQ